MEISAPVDAMFRTALSFSFPLTLQAKWTAFVKKFWRPFAGYIPILM
jgi:hypothetical protein